MSGLMLSIEMVGVSQARRKLRNVKGGLHAAIVGSLKRTRKEMITWASTAIRSRVNIKKKDLDKHLTASWPTKAKPSVRMTMEKSSRLSLKYFGIKQVYGRMTKVQKARAAKLNIAGSRTGKGVRYKVDPRKGSQVLARGWGADVQRWAKLGGHGYVREGKSRYPIAKLHGPSAWGVFVSGGGWTVKQWRRYGRERLRINLKDQVRYRLLKAAGKV